ncbi:MAG: oligosaccharide flippase family protein, partial [Caulobacteraceae bacterium]
RLGWPPEAVRFAGPYSLAVLATVRATPQGVCQLAGRFDLVGLQQVVPALVRLIGALVVLAIGGGLLGFLVAWLVSALVETITMWAFGFLALRKLKLTEPLIGPLRGVQAENQGLVGFILTTNFDLTLRDLAPNLVPLTVGWMLGPAAAGLLSLAQRATSVLHQPAILLSEASYSVFAKLASARDWAGLRHTAWRSAGLAMLIGTPILVALGLFGRQIMGLIGGGAFVAGGPLLFLLALARTVALGSALLIAALTAMGRPAGSISVNLFANVALYPLLPALLYLIGLDGAGWHAVLQNLLSAGLLAWLFTRALRQAGSPLPSGEGT